MKIVIFEVEPWEYETFTELQQHHDVEFTNLPLTKVNVQDYGEVDIVSTFIYSNLHREVLEKLPNLKAIATRSTGYDHIDMDYCQEHDITVSNVPSYGDNTVAEHVFGLLLTISHKLTDAIDRTRRGDFSQQGLQGFDLRDKTFGVIGTGSIGQCVIEIATGFRMNVIAFDVSPNPELAENLGFEYVSMDELLGRSDIITLHVPANPKTHHLLDEPEFEKMKDGVVIINTARGSLMNIHALVQAIATDKVAAVGLDVLPDEPTMREEAELLRSFYRKQHDLETLLADHILLRLRNAIVTPHSAFNTREAVQRILDVTAENIIQFTRGEEKNLVAA